MTPEIIHTLSIITTVIGVGYYIHRDVRDDMKTHSARTDKLYEMFCTMQTDYNEKFTRMDQKFYEKLEKTDQKFYDILKEKKDG
jgi:hypothetical protein